MIISAPEELNIFNVEALYSSIVEAEGQDLTLDCGNVTEVDGSGLQLLCYCQQQQLASLINLSECIQSAAPLLGMQDLLAAKD
ncbi:STAS domain-containing protein [Bowmanella sp. JS7-9]|uniref:STAS domain-containing protein n=1 Tax=Pseudobowmanella zhangzhouensis TaxID=1537679 RepID=A0ABW1XM27_9ALTE|nr:STAS domain-containing protein [Bowmanella sp. JS7-9]TBX20594.1 hypothetical protein TK45_14905 [Bowmanella sp. JS7-9]